MAWWIGCRCRWRGRRRWLGVRGRPHGGPGSVGRPSLPGARAPRQQ
jgi:hypothetical protein